MFSSLDCMHYHWKNCDVAWHGSFINKDGNKSIILEVIKYQRLWIWHAYFGLPKGNNDLNVLDRSPLIQDLLGATGVDFNFEVNGNVPLPYYSFIDGIYP